MIRKWYEPTGFLEGLKRSFSFFNVSILGITLLFVSSEFRFDWCEKLLGAYLLSNNGSRPEKGVVWEVGRESLNAHNILERMVARKESTRVRVRETQTFLELISRLGPGQWVTLEKQAFRKFYRSLFSERPSLKAMGVMDPAKLVWLLKGARVDRIFCEGILDGVSIYFIDDQNRVVEQIRLEKETLFAMGNVHDMVLGRLEEIEGFSGRVYPADRFFEAVFKLPRKMIPDLIQNPDHLLDQDGTLQKVGIWNQAEAGFIQLGFELEHRGRSRVVFMQAREWAVWQLGLILKGAIK